jgi:hypothetical protein
MWHYVTNHLIISNDKDSNSENRIKLRVRDSAHYFFSAPTLHSLCSSLCPSQSASQVSTLAVGMLVALPFPHNSIHPIQYPEMVLWTLKDCKADKYMNVSNGNQSQPSMKRLIQDENGTPISDSLWKLIQKSAVLVAHTYLANLPTPSQAGAGQPWKKAFFKCYYPSEWDQALRKLEVQAPLLSLCFVDWKADQMLGGVLQDKLAHSATAAHSTPPSCLTTPSSLGVTDLPGPPSARTANEKLEDLKKRTQQYVRDRTSCDDIQISYLETLEDCDNNNLRLAQMLAR